MAGLLDFISSPAGIGLLSAAAGTMAGARRGQPWNTAGRGAIAGLTGYSAAQDDVFKKQQLEEAQKLQALQRQQIEGQLSKQQREMERDQGFRDYIQSQTKPAAPGYKAVANTQSLFDMQTNPPTAENNFGVSTADVPGSPATFMGKKMDSGMAGILPFLDPKEALSVMQKSGPKVKEWNKVKGADGKTLFAPFFEDGTSGNPVPLEVAEKLHFGDSGGAIQGMDPFSGAPVGAPMKKTMTPGEVASNKVQWANYGNSRDRLSFDKSQTGKPIFNADAGGFVYAPSASQPEGRVVKVNGLAPKMNDTQAASAGYSDRMQQAEYLLSDESFKKSQKPEKIAQAVKAIPSFGLGEVVGNQLETAPRQQVRQAQEDWVRAKLRKESGAVISPQEMSDEIKTYFPQIGDSAAVIEQKGLARVTAKDGMQRQAGSTYKAPENRVKTVTLDDIAETARKSGKTTEEVTKDLKAKGYTIGGK